MMVRSLSAEELLDLYHQLFEEIGPRHWWPADSPFEVIVGAILTQNTAWKNVKKAIGNLKQHDLLEPEKLAEIPEKELGELIRPSGYFNQKSRRIKYFVDYFLRQYNGSIEQMSDADTQTLKSELLALNGIGPETADSILLYALNKPVFVVDNYTRRVFYRHNWFQEDIGYQDMQDFFTERLPAESVLFNEFHALIDYVGHFYCRNNPLCHVCPLQNRLQSEQ